MSGVTFFAVPSPETRQRFAEIVSSGPVSLDPRKFAIRLAEDVTTGDQELDTQYVGQISWLGIQYNDDLQYYELVAKIECEELKERARQLGAPDDYEPFMVMASPAPAMSRTHNVFLASVHTILASREKDFVFIEHSIPS